MEITLWHGVEYDVETAVAVEDVIKSLEANANIHCWSSHPDRVAIPDPGDHPASARLYFSV